MISVILPVYNNEQTVERCINSLLNQTRKDYELIIVEDKSNDNSLELIKKFRSKKIKLVLPKEKGGRAGAKNCGLDKVKKSKYVVFAEGDAWYDSNYLDECIKTLEERKLASTLGLLEVWNEDESWVTKVTQAERVYAHRTRKPFGGWVFRTDQIKGLRFKDLMVGEDVEFSNHVRKFGEIDWCRSTKWHHREAASLGELFMKNRVEGGRMKKFYKDNPRLARKFYLKNFYIPALTILWCLSFVPYVWMISLLASLPLLFRYLKFVYVTGESRVMLIWIVKSWARVLV